MLLFYSWFFSPKVSYTPKVLLTTAFYILIIKFVKSLCQISPLTLNPFLQYHLVAGIERA